MNPKISIIIPIYKSEPYIHKCMKSILNQTFLDFEVILVNDGSPDNCGEICDEYAKKDNRVKVIHKENGGSASARNAGLDIARGEYIGFVDPDDYIDLKMYETLYNNAIKYESDLVICDLKKVKEGEKHENLQYDDDIAIEKISNIQALNELYGKNAITYDVIWNKLYLRSIFDDIRLPEDIWYDDAYVSHQILYKCKNIIYIRAKLYFYLKREGSMVGGPFKIKNLDVVYVDKARVEFFKNIKHKELYYKANKEYMNVFFWNYNKAKLDLKLKDNDEELIKLKQSYNEVLPDILKNPLIGLKQKIALIVFRISPFLYKFI